jgi:hypothetical protein
MQIWIIIKIRDYLGTTEKSAYLILNIEPSLLLLVIVGPLVVVIAW